MTPEEEKQAEKIKERIEEIKEHERALSRLGNDLWAEKDKLRNEYKKITGEEI